MNRFLNVAQPHPAGDGETHFGNHLACVFTDDCGGNDFVGSLFAMNLAKPSVFAFRLSSIVILDRQLIGIEIRFLFLNFRIRRSGVGHFGIRVRHPTHDTVFRIEPIRPGHQRVERRVFGLRVGGVCKLKRRANITGCKNSFVGRTMMLVDCDASAMILNAGRFQVKALNIGDPPCLLYTSPSPRDATLSRMPSSA